MANISFDNISRRSLHSSDVKWSLSGDLNKIHRIRSFFAKREAKKHICMHTCPPFIAMSEWGTCTNTETYNTSNKNILCRFIQIVCVTHFNQKQICRVHQLRFSQHNIERHLSSEEHTLANCCYDSTLWTLLSELNTAWLFFRKCF